MSEISHYGVLGMKWGVRRYQNYDGSYTQRGIARYRKAESEYNTAKAKRKEAKRLGDKVASKNASGEMKIAKRSMNKAYKGLKSDKLADQGKALYKSGKTISGNTKIAAIREGAAIIGANVVGSALINSGHVELGAKTAKAILLGGTAVNAVLTGKEYYENKRLRAYYAH